MKAREKRPSADLCDECRKPRPAPWSPELKGYYCGSCRRLYSVAAAQTDLRLAMQAHDDTRAAIGKLTHGGAKFAAASLRAAMHQVEKAITRARKRLDHARAALQPGDEKPIEEGPTYFVGFPATVEPSPALDAVDQAIGTDPEKLAAAWEKLKNRRPVN